MDVDELNVIYKMYISIPKEKEKELTQTKKASVKKTDAKKTKKEEKKIEGTKGKGGNSQVKTQEALIIVK